jgi:predicted adenylyl cyclase CyaB
MAHINFEFKARVQNLEALEKKLLELGPVFTGEDRQVDTYLNVPEGRLKLREGNIENALIYYQRKDLPDAKQSDVIVCPHMPGGPLKEILVRVHGIKVSVCKVRRIYFVKNVKIHFDTIEELGSFLEVEAIDTSGEIPVAVLQEQCRYFADFFGIRPEDYVSGSYSDLIGALSQG